MSTGTPLKNTLLSFPTASTLLITINRPSSLNCLDTFTHNELDRVFRWFDAEPGLRCAILTGVGRSFCAGADLKEWDSNNSLSTSASSQARSLPASGFGGLKSHAVFALPEVKIGVVALAGALTRLVRTVGKQRAMEMALTGRTLGAEEAMEWGLVNRVVGTGKSVEEAIKLAELIAANSPDSVIVSREGIKMGWEGVGAEEGTRLIEQNWYSRMDKGPNMKEGVRSFVEKRKPNWVPSKL
ncbi:putative enoyl- hydratase protein [Botrytis fragariae]|uniref:Putative enoyl- hydratase protein n=1 Tax=Botrytis fragariae TaxID=1964551 RepID=A0A8H6AKA3_9HELO|nr:putative enoyl- hydratase protein [Botrytis fragariae]KAF5868810.1 putative enoyl- hydratase protein [Botrytis fragariae]